MPTTNVTARNRGLLALFCVASLMLVTAGPAWAAKTVKGAGAGLGSEDGGEVSQSCDPLMLPFMGTLPNSNFVLSNTGNFTATDSQGQTSAVYVGPHTMTIHIDAHVISPEGTFTYCNVPGPVPVQSWTVRSPNQPNGTLNTTQAGVTCTSAATNPATLGAGQYERRSANTVQFLLRGSCSVRGNVVPFTGNAKDVPTDILVEGEMHPCFDPFTGDPIPGACPYDPNAGSNLEITYQAGGVDPTIP